MSEQQEDYLVVEVDQRWFALPTRLVEAAVAPRPVTPLPFVPVYVEGLVNVNERILPLLDLRRLLGLARQAAGSELVIITTPRAACALRVDRVIGKASVAADTVQSHRDHDADSEAEKQQAGGNAPGSDIDSAIACARFEWEARPVLVLDDDAIGRSVCAREIPQGQRGLLGRLQDEAGQQQHTLDCLVFECAGEMYAMDLQDTLEILDLAAATPLPGAPAAVEGLARVRDDVVLVLSLPRLLRRGDNVAGASTVILVERDGARYGLRIDRLDGIHAFAQDSLRRVDDDSGELVGVLAGAERLYGLMTPARLINAALHAALQPLLPRRQSEASATRELLHPVLQIALGDEDFAIPLGQVRRIAGYCAPEPLRDDAQGLVAGAVTVDGNVLPVLALAQLLHAGGDNTGAWIIVGDDNREWAIAVRAAKQILEIPASTIEDIGNHADGFVTAVASVDNRLLSLLSMAPLLAMTAPLHGNASGRVQPGSAGVPHAH